MIDLLDLCKTSTASGPLPASISQFSLVGEATDQPPPEKQSSESLVDEPEGDVSLRKSSLIDTHCHVHELIGTGSISEKWHADNLHITPESVILAAHDVGVNRMITIGTSLLDSQLGVRFAQQYDGIWASIGIHPHEAKDHLTDKIWSDFAALAVLDKVVAVGEIGLDYYYNLSSKRDQETVLRQQLELAVAHNLPISFHVRDAFDDFWPIFDSYRGVRGVLHSYTDNLVNLEKALTRGLLIGVNGISTFAKDDMRQVVNRSVPADRLLLETDAPYLAPQPFRGKVCEPKHIRNIAEYLAQLRDESLETLAAQTSANAEKLFKLGYNR